MPQELLFELNGARVTPHIATFGGTSYQISNIGSVRVMQRKKYNPLAQSGWMRMSHCVRFRGEAEAL